MRMPESVFSSGWIYQGRCGGWGFQEAQEPDRMLDDLGRKTMSFVRYRGHTETVPVPPPAGYRLNVSMPIEGLPKKRPHHN